MSKALLRFTLAAIAAMLPARAWAHPDHDAGGLAAGLLHPLTGLDHLVAMSLVGIAVVMLARSCSRLVLTAFVASLATGYAVSSLLPPAFVEQVILLSLVLVGTAVLLRLEFRAAIIFVAAAIFGFAHGAAHGIDMPGFAGSTLFAAGFMTTSVVLLGAGSWMACVLPVPALRALGAAGTALGMVSAMTA